MARHSSYKSSVVDLLALHFMGNYKIQPTFII